VRGGDTGRQVVRRDGVRRRRRVSLQAKVTCTCTLTLCATAGAGRGRVTLPTSATTARGLAVRLVPHARVQRGQRRVEMVQRRVLGRRARRLRALVLIMLVVLGVLVVLTMLLIVLAVLVVLTMLVVLAVLTVLTVLTVLLLLLLLMMMMDKRRRGDIKDIMRMLSIPLLRAIPITTITIRAPIILMRAARPVAPVRVVGIRVRGQRRRRAVAHQRRELVAKVQRTAPARARGRVFAVRGAVVGEQRG
jgi:hypothetical protein